MYLSSRHDNKKYRYLIDICIETMCLKTCFKMIKLIPISKKGTNINN